MKQREREQAKFYDDDEFALLLARALISNFNAAVRFALSRFSPPVSASFYVFFDVHYHCLSWNMATSVYVCVKGRLEISDTT